MSDNGTIHVDADKELRLLWQASLNARVRLIEEQIATMERELKALRESLKGVCEP